LRFFYRLGAAQLIFNDQNAYMVLSRKTAEARRDGTFADLVDLTRYIRRRCGGTRLPRLLGGSSTSTAGAGGHRHADLR
jgi:hypothetical protein